MFIMDIPKDFLSKEFLSQFKTPEYMYGCICKALPILPDSYPRCDNGKRSNQYISRE